MTVEEFLDLFIKELEINPGLRHYYRLLESKNRYLWRKAYLQNRLQYVNNQVDLPGSHIWDVGCGYGTTALFLALNGHHVYGNTLEFYFNQIGNRLEYWKKYGNLDNLNIEYANLFDLKVEPHKYDYIIAQDTLHHLEPIDDAIRVFRTSLKPGGKMIAVEENGNSAFIRLKNFYKRGFNKVSTYYDERLKKIIPFGNENARSFSEWKSLFDKTGFSTDNRNCEHVRLYPHFLFNHSNHHLISGKESKIAAKHPLIREYLFFGINFTAIKRHNNEEKQ